MAGMAKKSASEEKKRAKEKAKSKAKESTLKVTKTGSNGRKEPVREKRVSKRRVSTSRKPRKTS